MSIKTVTTKEKGWCIATSTSYNRWT